VASAAQSRVRLLLVTFDPPENIGGIEGRANNYTQQLVKLGHYVEVISLSPDSKYTEESFHGATLLRFPSSSRRALGDLRKTGREVSKNSIDSIFLLSGAITLYGTMLLVYARLRGVRTLAFFYGKDILTAKKSGVSASIFLWLAPRLANMVAVNSQYTSTLLPKKYGGRAHILYPSIDAGIAVAHGGALKTPGGGRKTVLFVGRLVKRKGADDLIRAFKMVLEHVPDATLEIVGDGPELGSLKELAEGLQIQGTVKFYGALSGDALWERYSNCDVFVMPSKKTEADVEGFGTVFLEAAAFGKPSIGTYSGGIPEAILDHVTGVLVPEGDVSQLASSLENLLSNPELARELGNNARMRVTSEFTWEKATESLVSIFERNKKS
jgi:glycosyltransferase involved in cell wall biosynthesis